MNSLISKFIIIKHTKDISDFNKNYALLIRRPFINDEIIELIEKKIIKEVFGTTETLSLYAKFEVKKTLVEKPNLAWSNFCFKKYPNLPKNIISVTGTNGKTSTCHYISQILTAMKVPNVLINTIGIYENNIKIFNSPNSTPDAALIHKVLNDFALKHTNGFAIIESTSIGIEECRVSNVRSNVAVFTNLTKEHMDYHKTMDNYLNAKMKLGEKSNKFFIHNSVNQNKFPKYGEQLVEIKYENEKSVFVYQFDEKIYEITVKLVGKFNAENVLSAMIALKEFFPIESFVGFIQNLEPADGRLNKYGNIIIDYAHTLDGVKNIFNAIKNDSVNKIIVVMGFGGNSDWTRLTEVSEFLQDNADIVFLTTDNPKFCDPMEIALKAQKICSKAIIELYREKAILKAYEISKHNSQSIVLVLGKGHEPYMSIKSEKIPYSDKETVMKIINLN
ncbi:UDP-N-acetylmuramyl-tripeptide synthetase [Alphaproteobacteria bacterium endosymbiont of Tiliacea citrago]|uniref:Mur ligase family protein n=1 Tax=Alphaproteobacteria bacterium endosymbiont of Tiliacea citrago TaxID=3077944 RepID=UPI00313D1A7D